MLPKIDVPIYDIKLISCKKPVKFRPFLVKEQKLLLMAQENNTDDKDYVLNIVKQIINNCLITEINVDELPMFDIEYLFLNLRARSMGEVVNLNYRCANQITDSVTGTEEPGKTHNCNNIVNFDINLLNIKPKIEKEHTNKIEINENLGLLMKYPNLETFKDIDFSGGDVVLTTIFSCIDAIYDAETIYYTKDVDKKELEEFVDGLPASVVEKIKNFFDTMPKIKETIHFKCNKCQYEEDIFVEGLDSFFG